jgi:hypothetical protein
MCGPAAAMVLGHAVRVRTSRQLTMAPISEIISSVTRACSAAIRQRTGTTGEIAAHAAPISASIGCSMSSACRRCLRTNSVSSS